MRPHSTITEISIATTAIYYSDVNPFWLRRVDNQHQWRVNAWCGILDGQIVRPHFFNANLNRAMYLQFLQTDLQELMENINLQILRACGSNTMAPRHTMRVLSTIIQIKGFLNIG